MKKKKTKQKRLSKAAKKISSRKKVVRKQAVRKKTVKKSAKKITVKAKKIKSSPPAYSIEQLQEAGKIVHYFPKVKAGIILISQGKKIAIGDTLYIKGHTTDLKQAVSSMQVNHVAVKEAGQGEEIGLLVKSRVRVGDTVYKI